MTRNLGHETGSKAETFAYIKHLRGASHWTGWASARSLSPFTSTEVLGDTSHSPILQVIEQLVPGDGGI